MTSRQIKRRLAAIASLDVVGFSRLMGEDEVGTLASLKFCRSNIIDPSIESHGGRVFKLIGDGALVEFDSVVSGVECASDIQHKLGKWRQEDVSQNKIQFRIGLNLGDVIIDGEDMYGDGVNVASRIEALADPGGICVSGSVYEQVKDKIENDFWDLGVQRLKNIKDEVRLYKVLGSKQVDVFDDRTIKTEKPSIAVLPFMSRGSDSEQEIFSDGISEDIITGLGKINGIQVIARSSTSIYKNKSVDVRQVSREQGVRYVLEGSVRKSGDRIRVTAQLNDGTTGQQIWSDKYDRVIEDIFELQDELMREIVVALDVKLIEGNQAKLWSSGTKNVQAWECVRQGAFHILGAQRAKLPLAKELLDKALSLDPNYAIAWVMMGWYYQNFVDVAGGVEHLMNVEDSLSKMKECADKAISIDPNCADAYSLYAMYHMENNDFDAAQIDAEKSVALAPGNAENMMETVVILVKTGQPGKALALAKQARELCPVLRPGFMRSLALAYRFTGNLNASYETYREAVDKQPDRLAGHVNLASVLGEMEKIKEAKAIAKTVLEMDPYFSINAYGGGLSYRNSEDLERILNGLRKAGLPE